MQRRMGDYGAPDAGGPSQPQTCGASSLEEESMVVTLIRRQKIRKLRVT
jgi:hypothetical protein